MDPDVRVLGVEFAGNNGGFAIETITKPDGLIGGRLRLFTAQLLKSLPVTARVGSAVNGFDE